MGPFARGSRFSKTLRGKTALNTSHFFTELKRRNIYKVAQVSNLRIRGAAAVRSTFRLISQLGRNAALKTASWKLAPHCTMAVFQLDHVRMNVLRC
jgi:hypothetical protein